MRRDRFNKKDVVFLKLSGKKEQCGYRNMEEEKKKPKKFLGFFFLGIYIHPIPLLLFPCSLSISGSLQKGINSLQPSLIISFSFFLLTL